MPVWLAHLTPWIDDAGTEEHWPEVVKRYADLQERWHVLSGEDWKWLEYRVKQIALREAMTHTDDAEVLKACTNIDAVLCRALEGKEVTQDEWNAAARAANATAAADRMIDQILDAIEQKVEGHEHETSHPTAAVTGE